MPPLKLKLPVNVARNTRLLTIALSFRASPPSRSSASFGDLECTLGPREQVNMATAFLDASHIYGASDAAAEQVRDRPSARGLLRVQRRNAANPNEDLLPPSQVKSRFISELYAEMGNGVQHTQKIEFLREY